ncbi:MAG TPA: Flp pilus assembly protein CpaB [Burkholderiales bacterium]|nr:Flp pilus assembly protein CpaB [Burkholderiales bacterium]
MRFSLPRINRTWLMLIVALLLGGLASWLTAHYLKSREKAIEQQVAEKARGGKTVTVVVPVKDLLRDTPITAEVVAARDIPADLVYDNTVLADNFDSIKGLKLLHAVPRGRPLLQDDVEEKTKDFADLLPPGTRAITMDVDEVNSLSNMIKPGNYVDLFLITTDPANPMNGQQIVPVLQRVKVLATGEQAGRRALEEETGPRGAQARRYSNITFEVAPEQAARIALAQQLGKVRAVLRNSEDAGNPDVYAITEKMLVQGVMLKPGFSAGPSVDFIIGGKTQTGVASAAAPVINVTVPNLPGMGGGNGGGAQIPMAGPGVPLYATPPAGQ